MRSALGYLAARSARNRVLRQVRMDMKGGVRFSN